MVEGHRRQSGLAHLAGRELAPAAGERTYLRLESSRKLADVKVAAIAGTAGAAAAGIMLLTALGALSPALSALLVAFLAIVAGALITTVNRQGLAALEIMPGTVRLTGGWLGRRESIVIYQAVVAASLAQGPIERHLSRTATLELTLACRGGLVRLRLAGLANAAARREELLGIAATESLAEPELERLRIERENSRTLGELLDEMRQTRQRLERL